MKFSHPFPRRVAGVLLAAALFVLPLTATAAPGDSVAASWATSWQALVDTVVHWFVADPADDAGVDVEVNVRDANGLGSTLDPDGFTTPLPPQGSDLYEILPESGLGSTLDPDG